MGQLDCFGRLRSLAMTARMDKEKIRHLEEADRRLIWHPFTQMQDYEKETPLIIERGEGNFLFPFSSLRGSNPGKAEAI